MTPLQFETNHGLAWDELEAALAQGRGKLRIVPRRGGTAREAAAPDPARLAALYRITCEHLALARSRAYPARLTDRLDRLTQRAHELIYRRSDLGLARLGRLFLVGFPEAVRAHRRYVGVASGVFVLPLLLTGLATYFDPSFILTMHGVAAVRAYQDMYGPAAEHIGQRGSDSDWMMFGYYLRNNIGISFRCFAGGIFFGLGSLFYLAYNGAAAGTVAGFLTARGNAETFYSFVVSHGAFELTAIVLSGAAGLRLGHALLAPGRRTRRAALELAAAESAVLVYGVVAMLLIAAGLEAFWSSAHWIAPGVKFGVGGGCWALVVAYLCCQGRPRSAYRGRRDAG